MMEKMEWPGMLLQEMFAEMEVLLGETWASGRELCNRDFLSILFPLRPAMFTPTFGAGMLTGSRTSEPNARH